jgi:hypothetical protein
LWASSVLALPSHFLPEPHRSAKRKRAGADPSARSVFVSTILVVAGLKTRAFVYALLRPSFSLSSTVRVFLPESFAPAFGLARPIVQFFPTCTFLY